MARLGAGGRRLWNQAGINAGSGEEEEKAECREEDAEIHEGDEGTGWEKEREETHEQLMVVTFDGRLSGVYICRRKVGDLKKEEETAAAKGREVGEVKVVVGMGRAAVVEAMELAALGEMELAAVGETKEAAVEETERVVVAMELAAVAKELAVVVETEPAGGDERRVVEAVTTEEVVAMELAAVAMKLAVVVETEPAGGDERRVVEAVTTEEVVAMELAAVAMKLAVVVETEPAAEEIAPGAAEMAPEEVGKALEAEAATGPMPAAARGVL